MLAAIMILGFIFTVGPILFLIICFDLHARLNK